MIDVYVCEDDPKQLNQVVEYIENYLLIENLDMKVQIATGDPSEILDYLNNNEIDKSLYFIDIDLGENNINGIELASKIRKIDIEGKIVFITNHSEMVFLTFKYQIEALDFILKDYPEKIQGRIIEDINLCNKQFEMSASDNEEYFQIKTGELVRSIKVSDILFFESSPVPHKVIVHLKDGQFEFYSMIKRIEDENESFFRCHKSYVVNVDNVESVNKHTREATMIDGEKVLCSVLGTRTLVKLKK
ncbi:LytR/AlgR family response regulator transcription factor [Companilactobacillus kimchii]|uniref:LytR/AlgR family response regulator transcription factor n=1 Tax=Companilactobacillus kimchii TaxID=2801452 RepID=UPI000704AD9B|nr:LytTR family DNA-binding domain-containing protein [Companilactobacillus kimchii]KAE9562291.1 two-component system response regulator [Companilactobacillus kimchii]GEO46364.1 DNA-binding response regulator [Companilactobacillus paralimentarius]